MSCDGTDFQVYEHGRKWYSHKNKKSALRYEVCLSIITGDIVWINVPFVAGKHNDIIIFRSSLVSHLSFGERVEADDGYIGEAPQCIKCPMSVTNPAGMKEIQGRVRSRQETVNRRFKDWGILKQVYRHDLPSHSEVFRAIAVITQIAIDSGEKLFSYIYRDHYFFDFVFPPGVVHLLMGHSDLSRQ